MTLLNKISKIVIYCLLKIPFSQLCVICLHVGLAQPLVITVDFMYCRFTRLGFAITIKFNPSFFNFQPFAFSRS